MISAEVPRIVRAWKNKELLILQNVVSHFENAFANWFQKLRFQFHNNDDFCFWQQKLKNSVLKPKRFKQRSNHVLCAFAVVTDFLHTWSFTSRSLCLGLLSIVASWSCTSLHYFLFAFSSFCEHLSVNSESTLSLTFRRLLSVSPVDLQNLFGIFFSGIEQMRINVSLRIGRHTALVTQWII